MALISFMAYNMALFDCLGQHHAAHLGHFPGKVSLFPLPGCACVCTHASTVQLLLNQACFQCVACVFGKAIKLTLFCQTPLPKECTFPFLQHEALLV